MKRVLTVVIEKDVDGGYIASVPQLPGCFSQGETMDELRENIREAIDLYLEDADLPEDLPEFVSVEQIEVHV